MSHLKFFKFFRSQLISFVYLTFFVLTIGAGGCGYSFQSSKNLLYLKEGIQKVYIPPLINNTYKPGVEILVYNNLIRTLSAHGRVVIVRSQSEADALLQGIVVGASYTGSGARTSVSGLNPLPLGERLPTKDFTINTEYTAFLTCNFLLRRVRPVQGKPDNIWSSTFTRSEPFPASNQLDIPGTTSALINESEFDRALSDLARSMMSDLHESMLAMF
jgi:hypothetical protein